MTNNYDNDDFDAMFNENDDVFSGLDDPDLQTFNRLPFFNPEQTYVLEIDCIKFTKSTQNMNRFWHLEFNIVESTDENLPAGTQARHTITVSSVTKYKNYGPAAFRGFLSAVTGIAINNPKLPADFWKTLSIAALKEDKLNGKKVILRTVNNSNNEKYPFHNYSTYKG